MIIALARVFHLHPSAYIATPLRISHILTRRLTSLSLLLIISYVVSFSRPSISISFCSLFVPLVARSQSDERLDGPRLQVDGSTVVRNH